MVEDTAIRLSHEGVFLDGISEEAEPVSSLLVNGKSANAVLDALVSESLRSVFQCFDTTLDPRLHGTTGVAVQASTRESLSNSGA